MIKFKSTKPPSTNKVIGYTAGKFLDFDEVEAPTFKMSKVLSHNPNKKNDLMDNNDSEMKFNSQIDEPMENESSAEYDDVDEMVLDG